MIAKFPEDQRTFETRLEFIRDLFANLYPQCDIMAHSITYKLDKSYLRYVKALEKSELNLTGKDPLAVLKNIK